MPMDYKDKRGFSFRRLLYSFRQAFTGIKEVLLHEQNMKIHLMMALAAILLAIWFNIPKEHWLILIILIGIVLSLEAMNSAIERTVDLVTKEYQPLAKAAKDAASAAVLIFSIVAVIVGIIIFFPPFIEWLQEGW